MAKLEVRSGRLNFMNIHFRCDVDFVSYETYKQALENGFCPITWERKNKNKVYINGIHYTEI